MGFTATGLSATFGAAGSETTSLGGLIAIIKLLEFPEVMERMRADRSLVPDAINEIIRFGMSGPGGQACVSNED